MLLLMLALLNVWGLEFSVDDKDRSCAVLVPVGPMLLPMMLPAVLDRTRPPKLLHPKIHKFSECPRS